MAVGWVRAVRALMLHVIYKGRALPLTWVVRQCPKGHAPEALHIERVEPTERASYQKGQKSFSWVMVNLMGAELQKTMNEAGWWYACRTAKSTVATWEELTFHLDLLRQ